MPGPSNAPDVIDVHVGERVRAERTRCSISQADLGEAIGVSFQQVQKYERGANRISASMLMRIARALDVPVAEFFPPADRPGPIDIGALQGGADLAECYAAMTPGQRAMLLSVAREFTARTG